MPRACSLRKGNHLRRPEDPRVYLLSQRKAVAIEDRAICACYGSATVWPSVSRELGLASPAIVLLRVLPRVAATPWLVRAG